MNETVSILEGDMKTHSCNYPHGLTT